MLTPIRHLSFAVTMVTAAFMSACGTFPKNPVLDTYDKNIGYRFEQLDAGDNSDRLFVIITFSGGGTRAAAL